METKRTLTPGEEVVRRSCEELHQELGRWPTISEVVDQTGIARGSVSYHCWSIRNKGYHVETSRQTGGSRLNVHLSTRQQQIFDWTRDYILRNGYGPSLREIGKQFGINSPNGVICHLRALERKGYIRRVLNMSRAIRLVGQDSCPHCHGTGILHPDPEGPRA